MIELVTDGINRRSLAAKAGGEVIDHQLVDDQVSQWPTHPERNRPIGRVTDNEPGVLRPCDLPGARIGDPSTRAVGECDVVLVLIKARPEAVLLVAVHDTVTV